MAGAVGGLRPVVWAVALLWLPVRWFARRGDRVLEVYVDTTDRAGRALRRGLGQAGRWLLRVLGPLGRALKRALTPPWRLLQRTWDRLGLWITLRMLRPLRAWAQRLLVRLQPLVRRAEAWGARVLARVEPVERAVLSGLEALERAVDRFGARWGARLRRWWQPVAAVLAALPSGRSGRSRGRQREPG